MPCMTHTRSVTMKQATKLEAVTQPRTIEHIITGVETSDGAGVKLTRVLTQNLQQRLDPFLMLDNFHSDDPDDYIAGFPDHPHRGFETVTYMIAGHMRHRDNAGHEGLLQNGGVQWMTAGRGIIHSEMPEQEDGVMEGFQLWLNLPARSKMIPAWYRDIPKSEIPEYLTPEGVSVRVIAPVIPLLVPAMTRTDTPSGVKYSGISDFGMSRYQAGIILLRAGRFSQSWKPSMTPSSCSGISEWMMPRPAVIHCTPPFCSSPSCPALSRWRIRPAIM